jgi:hypothetical protein
MNKRLEKTKIKGNKQRKWTKVSTNNLHSNG